MNATATLGPATIRLGWCVGLVQALLALSWTVYALFLPSLAVRAGLPASSVIWILLLDQALFVLCDWGAAVYAERTAQAWQRLGAAIAVAACGAGLLFAAMPWVAAAGQPTGLLALVVGWAVLSSFLRAPVLMLLVRLGGATRQGWAVGLVLGVVSMAGAVGQLLAQWLRDRDPQLPFALASMALALAALVAVRAAAHPPAAREAVTPADVRLAPLLVLAALVVVAGLGFQWHTVLLASSSPLPWVRTLWAPLFWGGFALGLLGSQRLSKMPWRLRGVALVLAAGALATQLAVQSAAPGLLVAGQLLAGAGWAALLHTGMGLALARSAPERLASPIGLVLSALALAALLRVLTVALHGAQTAAAWTALPCVAWLLAGAGLWWHPWRAEAGREPR